MDLAKAVLLPIDMQRGFDGPPWPRRWNDRLDANGLALLAAWRATGRPLIHVRHDSVEPGSVFVAGSPGNALRGGFEPRPGEPLVSKSVNSAFIGTDLDLRLRRLGVDTVVAFGVSTDMCVSTTVRVGANLGYRMILVGDACDCFDLPDGHGGTVKAEDVHRAHLATLGYEFATVVDTAALLAALSARAA
ncbi:cysteine hydrolase family protein [Caulobacter sp. 17J65-9]|uniref:cysteine hydrolase family protein n=1 Tax=Caulobacter sp. 17J65-9 TaxID=2709382 RepID=UPI0013C85A20|nr:cysteine hydrolase family protein [Caulobacter sp. 17J65-9]NEX92603.1 cysteine hydrolase [Caulobacter sp. 17J65-9]